MTYKNKLGTMDISHIFLTITLVALAIALLAPLHFNVNKLENVLTSLIYAQNPGNNPSYVSTNATLIKSNNLITITITIKNNGNKQLTIGGTTTIGSMLCDLEPSITIPPNSEGMLTLVMYTVNGTTTDPVTINLGGNAYSAGGVPEIFCYGVHTSIIPSNGFTITFSTIGSNGKIYAYVNQG